MLSKKKRHETYLKRFEQRYELILESHYGYQKEINNVWELYQMILKVCLSFTDKHLRYDMSEKFSLLLGE